jgi:hypothetical protein
MTEEDLPASVKGMSVKKKSAYIGAHNKATGAGLHPKVAHKAGVKAASAETDDNAAEGMVLATAPDDIQEMSLTRQRAYVEAYNEHMEENPEAECEECDRVGRAAANAVVGDSFDDGEPFEITEFQSFDDIEILPPRSNGFVVAVPRVARTGVQLYRGFEVGKPAMDVVRVYRPPQQVFARKAMVSLTHKPLTLDHPFDNVTSKNWKEHSVGTTGGEVARDGDFIRVPMTLMDQSAIDAVNRGKAQLSVGYGAKLRWGDGVTPDGEPYDAMQTDIEANHIAIVSQARGGNMLRIGDQKKKKPDEDEDDEDEKDQMEEEDSLDAKGGPKPKPDEEDEPDPDDPDEGDEPDEDEPEPKSKKKASEDASPEDGYGDRDYSTEAREEMAQSGAAMPHGGFPVKTEKDLRNAIQAFGRAKNKSATKAHIKKRARALGKTELLPESWKGSGGGDSASYIIKRRNTMRMLNIDGVSIEIGDKDAQILDRHLAALREDIDDATTKLGAAKKAVATKDGEIAALKKQLADAEMTPTKIDELVRDRVDVIDRARRTLGDKVVADGKPNPQIMRDVVSELMGAQAVRSMNDDAISGAFYALTSGKQQGGGRGINDVARSFSTGSAAIHNAMDAQETAYQKHNEWLQNAWKTPPRVAREIR